MRKKPPWRGSRRKAGRATGRQKGAIAFLSLAASPAGAGLPADPVPLMRIELLGADGESLGECLVAQQMQAAGFETETIALVRTAEGHRARLSWRLDPETGEVFQEMHDLSTGWRAEWVWDFGIGELAELDDFEDPHDWARLNVAQAEAEAAPSLHRFSTSDGVFVEWSVPSGGSEEEALSEAVAEIAAGFLERQPPDSVRAEVDLLQRLLGRPAARHLDPFDRFAETLSRALDAAAGRDPRPQADAPSIRELGRSKPSWVGDWSDWWAESDAADDEPAP